MAEGTRKRAGRTSSASRNSGNNDPVKITVPELRKRLEEIESGGYCYMCGEHKPKGEFYASTDPLIKTGLTPICKKCASSIACRVDRNGYVYAPTMDTMLEALSYLNKPFLRNLYESSLEEHSDTTSKKQVSNVFLSYMKNVSMIQYRGLTYKDSDIFKENSVSKIKDDEAEEEMSEEEEYAQFLKNKDDVIRLIGYEPFAEERLKDQPFLYSNLLGMLDSSEDMNDDMMRTSAAISCVRAFLQQAQIDDMIARIMKAGEVSDRNISTIKSLQETKQKISSTISSLAQDNCLSMKYSKGTKKGENTWTGKIKKIKDLNLREGEVNGFDINTCKGMMQVLEMSDASIMKQLHLEDSEYADMIADMRKTNVALRRDLDRYKEISRILLRENLDLKSKIEGFGVMLDEDLVDLDSLFEPFTEKEKESDE